MSTTQVVQRTDRWISNRAARTLGASGGRLQGASDGKRPPAPRPFRVHWDQNERFRSYHAQDIELPAFCRSFQMSNLAPSVDARFSLKSPW